VFDTGDWQRTDLRLTLDLRLVDVRCSAVTPAATIS